MHLWKVARQQIELPTVIPKSERDAGNQSGVSQPMQYTDGDMRYQVSFINPCVFFKFLYVLSLVNNVSLLIMRKPDFNDDDDDDDDDDVDDEGDVDDNNDDGDNGDDSDDDDDDGDGDGDDGDDGDGGDDDDDDDDDADDEGDVDDNNDNGDDGDDSDDDGDDDNDDDDGGGGGDSDGDDVDVAGAARCCCVSVCKSIYHYMEDTYIIGNVGKTASGRMWLHSLK